MTMTRHKGSSGSCRSKPHIVWCQNDKSGSSAPSTSRHSETNEITKMDGKTCIGLTPVVGFWIICKSFHSSVPKPWPNLVSSRCYMAPGKIEQTDQGQPVACCLILMSSFTVHGTRVPFLPHSPLVSPMFSLCLLPHQSL